MNLRQKILWDPKSHVSASAGDIVVASIASRVAASAAKHVMYDFIALLLNFFGSSAYQYRTGHIQRSNIGYRCRLSWQPGDLWVLWGVIHGFSEQARTRGFASLSFLRSAFIGCGPN